MSSLYKRIQSNSVKLGESFVLSDKTEEETIVSLSVQKRKLSEEIEKAKKDLAELKQSLSILFEQKDSIIEEAKKSEKPFAIVAKTIKGKGVSFMENNAGWHGKAPNDEQLLQALKELG